MPTSEEEVDAMLEDCNQRKPGMIERNIELARAIEYFMDLKWASDSRVEGLSLTWFYQNKLRPKLGGPMKIDTVKKFIREVLKLDPSTGSPL